MNFIIFAFKQVIAIVFAMFFAVATARPNLLFPNIFGKLK